MLVAIKEASSIAKNLLNQCLRLRTPRTSSLYRVTRDTVHPNDTHTHTAENSLLGYEAKDRGNVDSRLRESRPCTRTIDWTALPGKHKQHK
jgi:hypothetical protein